MLELLQVKIHILVEVIITKLYWQLQPDETQNMAVKCS